MFSGTIDKVLDGNLESYQKIYISKDFKVDSMKKMD